MISNKSKRSFRWKEGLRTPKNSGVELLILSSLERVEKISNAMDLRGFGKYKKRTWYTTKKFTFEDYIALGISGLILLISIAIGVFVNKGRFYNLFL
jgi:energy-coupling factor transport system permease protein